MQGTTCQKTQNVYTCSGGENDIFELIDDSDTENKKTNKICHLSYIYLKYYDISCLFCAVCNCSVKSNSLF